MRKNEAAPVKRLPTRQTHVPAIPDNVIRGSCTHATSRSRHQVRAAAYSACLGLVPQRAHRGQRSSGSLKGRPRAMMEASSTRERQLAGKRKSFILSSTARMALYAPSPSATLMMAKKTLLAVMPRGGVMLSRLLPKKSVLTRTAAAWKILSALLYLTSQKSQRVAHTQIIVQLHRWV
jgi:hypothetical protein